ncbi:MAG: hypothetical protein QNK04_22640 [Myxococcota bacterium]|nr:hypothetical protein [Myxococcota bacterium]
MRRLLMAAATAALAFTTACERFDTAPLETADSFWETLARGDYRAARALSTAPSEAELRELAETHPFASVETGQVLRNDRAALVETRATLEGPRGTVISFNTHLGRYDGAWRVDVEQTRREVVRSAIGAAVEDMKDSLRESAEVLTETLERGALEFSEALRQALEEMERDLSRPPPPPRPPRTVP